MMTPAQFAHYKEQLEALHLELTGKGPARIEPNRTSDNTVGDDEDEQPLNEMLQAIASNQNRTKRVILGRVVRALKKLQENPSQFGLCEECDDDIAAGRLNAMPYAICCVDCQGLRDGGRGSATRKKLTDYR